jgi:hypothetical protein
MFKEFSCTQFESQINRIIYPSRAKDITKELQLSGNPTMERIYEVRTKNPKVIIIIFSSVDVRTNATRENGKDRVRLVMRWETRNGYRYRHLDRRNRTDELFKNISESFNEAKTEVFSCEKFKWTPVLEEAL